MFEDIPIYSIISYHVWWRPTISEDIPIYSNNALSEGKRNVHNFVDNFIYYYKIRPKGIFFIAGSILTV
jgi:hypothetical protein